MRQLLNYKITDHAVEKIEYLLLQKTLDEITKEDFNEIVKYKDTFLFDIQDEYVWAYEDIHYIFDLDVSSMYEICYVKFYEIKELDLYILQESEEIKRVYPKRKMENFIENCSTNGMDYIMHIILNRIYWKDNNNIFKKAVDNFIKRYKDEKDGEDSLVFSGEGDAFQINLSGDVNCKIKFLRIATKNFQHFCQAG